MGDNIDAAMVGGNSETFVQHVFNFDEASKKEMMNVVQYCLWMAKPKNGNYPRKESEIDF